MFNRMALASHAVSLLACLLYLVCAYALFTGGSTTMAIAGGIAVCVLTLVFVLVMSPIVAYLLPLGGDEQ